jgi:hypothetical protein
MYAIEQMDSRRLLASHGGPPTGGLRNDPFTFKGIHHEQKSNQRHCQGPRWKSSGGCRQPSLRTSDVKVTAEGVEIEDFEAFTAALKS